MNIDSILEDPPTDLAFSPDEGSQCMNYDQCGNTAPGNNMMCSECLSRVRKKGRGHDAG